MGYVVAGFAAACHRNSLPFTLVNWVSRRDKNYPAHTIGDYVVRKRRFPRLLSVGNERLPTGQTVFDGFRWPAAPRTTTTTAAASDSAPTTHRPALLLPVRSVSQPVT